MECCSGSIRYASLKTLCPKWWAHYPIALKKMCSHDLDAFSNHLPNPVDSTGRPLHIPLPPFLPCTTDVLGLLLPQLPGVFPSFEQGPVL